MEDEIEELMCDYGLSPIDGRSIAKELRKTKHALWMARALRAKTKANFYNYVAADNIKVKQTFKKYNRLCEIWLWVERKCREKAKEFE